MVDQQINLMGLGPANTIKFGTFSIISHNQSCQFQFLFFIHLTPRTLRLGKSLFFISRCKFGYLTANTLHFRQ